MSVVMQEPGLVMWPATPMAVMAIGPAFSALEVVPLVLIGFEGWRFWNTPGAGIFGFQDNPPIAHYCTQGLNTTPLHGHTALFGVQRMCGL